LDTRVLFPCPNLVSTLKRFSIFLIFNKNIFITMFDRSK
jgi:hypothetical protein